MTDPTPLKTATMTPERVKEIRGWCAKDGLLDLRYLNRAEVATLLDAYESVTALREQQTRGEQE